MYIKTPTWGMLSHADCVLECTYQCEELGRIGAETALYAPQTPPLDPIGDPYPHHQTKPFLAGPFSSILLSVQGNRHLYNCKPIDSDTP